MNYRKKEQQKVIYLNSSDRGNYSMARPNSPFQGKQRNFKQSMISIMAGIVIIGIASVQLIQTMNESREAEEQYLAIKKQEKKSMEENIHLQQEYQQMKDPDYLADVARRDYFYSKPGEIIFDIPDTE